MLWLLTSSDALPICNHLLLPATMAPDLSADGADSLAHVVCPVLLDS